MSPPSARRFALRMNGVLGLCTAAAAISCARVQGAPAASVLPLVAAPRVEPVATDVLTPATDRSTVVQQGSPTRMGSVSAPPPQADAQKRVEIDAPAAVTPVPDLPTWDIDVHSYETTTRVAHYITRFAGPAHEYIQARLSDGTRFEPMIRESLRNGGIPEDMYYLALVESGFDPNAYSRAAAVGMWQFMSSTARGMGLRVDWWVDERRDPIKSTKAAVDFIRGLRDQFGSIYLAAAAYNGGPGRIARGLTKYADDLDGTAGDDLFFALADRKYLKNETREYVPQIIAAALIAKDPAKYGMDITVRPRFTYDSVTVPALTSLAAIARAAGSTVTELKALNPQILRGMAPPKTETVMRIPAGTAVRFDSAFAELPDSVHSGARVVRTRGGESVEKIAKLTGVSARQIGIFNKSLRRAKSGKYAADQIIYVPKRETVAAALSVPDPSIERWGTSGSSGSHVVRKGETLGSIAHHYHTTVASLMRANGLREKHRLSRAGHSGVGRSAIAAEEPGYEKTASPEGLTVFLWRTLAY